MRHRACNACGGTEIDYDPSRGDAVCIQCGTVLEENTIVNEVTFAQDAGGTSSVVGQFVSATPDVSVGAGIDFARDSREAAFVNGQRHIQQLANVLRLAEHHQEAAQRLFMLAVQHNFIQGRKTHNVIAACLYTVCRREKTPHLLIDFSDVLQSNVYVLGSTFLKFTRLLSLVLPIIDPSLYIHRFASRLELGDKTHLVSMSALRLVQRMKRDWIQTGRRPSGICGAALLIAARVHGFRRTQREVVRIVRICDVTLRKRLAEFTQTPLGALTARQLESLNLEAFAPADPPSFTANRRAEALAAGDDNADPAYLLDARRAARALQLKAMKVGYLRQQLADLGEATDGKKGSLVDRLLVAQGDGALMLLPPGGGDGAAGDENGGEAAGEEGGDDDDPPAVLRGPSEADAASSARPSLWAEADLVESRETQAGDPTDTTDHHALMDELNTDLEAYDAEVECYLITDGQEVADRTQLWEDMHRGYLEEQEARRAAREAARADGGGDENGENGGEAAAGAEPPRARGRKRGRRGDGSGGRGGPAASAAEAVDSELRRRNISSRINYDVVEDLANAQRELEEDGALAADADAAAADPAAAAAPAATANGDGDDDDERIEDHTDSEEEAAQEADEASGTPQDGAPRPARLRHPVRTRKAMAAILSRAPQPPPGVAEAAATGGAEAVPNPESEAAY